MSGLMAFFIRQQADREAREEKARRDREDREDRERRERQEREERDREDRRREDDARRAREEAAAAQRTQLLTVLIGAAAPLVTKMLDRPAPVPVAAPAAPDLTPFLSTISNVMASTAQLSDKMTGMLVDRVSMLAELGQPPRPTAFDRLVDVAEAAAPALVARFAGGAEPAPVTTPSPASSTPPAPVRLVDAVVLSNPPSAPAPAPHDDSPESENMNTTAQLATEPEPTLAEMLEDCEVPADAEGIRRALYLLRAFHGGMPDPSWLPDLQAALIAAVPDDLALAIRSNDAAKVQSLAAPVVMTDRTLLGWLMAGGGDYLKANMPGLQALLGTL